MSEKESLLLIKKLAGTGSLSLLEYEELIRNREKSTENLLKEIATEKRMRVYGNSVFIRGLIEISNICKNNCLYCGIRRENKNAERCFFKRGNVAKGWNTPLFPLGGARGGKRQNKRPEAIASGFLF